MLSRHFLRSKVLQEVYSCQIETKDNAQALREFDYHIGRLNELGVLQVSLLPRIAEMAAQVMEEGKKKYFATDEERKLFRLLIEVSGIGGKLALNVLSYTSVGAFCAAVQGPRFSGGVRTPGRLPPSEACTE